MKTLRHFIGLRLPVMITIVLLSLTAVSEIGRAYAYPEYIWGEASASEATQAGYNGYWEYCISIGWDVSEYAEGARANSHVTLVLELEDCLDDCGDACFILPDTVGTDGGAGGCTVYFYAEIDIKGDPTIPTDTPTLKFEPYYDDCEPGIAGTVSLCFYSLVPPEAGESEDWPVWIKFGPYIEQGMIRGTLPSCSGTAATGSSTWGSIKRLFR
jgi:hypothetical protein